MTHGMTWNRSALDSVLALGASKRDITVLQYPLDGNLDVYFNRHCVFDNIRGFQHFNFWSEIYPQPCHASSDWWPLSGGSAFHGIDCCEGICLPTNHYMRDTHSALSRLLNVSSNDIYFCHHIVRMSYIDWEAWILEMIVWNEQWLSPGNQLHVSD